VFKLPIKAPIHRRWYPDSESMAVLYVSFFNLFELQKVVWCFSVAKLRDAAVPCPGSQEQQLLKEMLTIYLI